MAHVTNLEPEVAEELPAGSRRHWAARVSSVFARLVEIPAALLVVAEIIVLLAGILARYVFHKPIVWSDELAGILFLWLAMLGAVVAFQRGEYMDDGSCRKGRSAQARIVAGRSVTAVVVRQLAAGIHPDIKPMLVTCWRS